MNLIRDTRSKITFLKLLPYLPLSISQPLECQSVCIRNTNTAPEDALTTNSARSSAETVQNILLDVFFCNQLGR